MFLSRYCEAELRVVRIVLPRVWMSVTWSSPDTSTLEHSPACSLHNIALCDNNQMSQPSCPAMSQSRMTDGDQVEACSDRTDMRPGYCPQCRPWWLVYKWSSALSPPDPIRLAPGGYMTQTTGLVSRQNSDTFSRKILLRGWLNILNIHKISKCNLRRKSPEDILYKSGRNLLIRNLLSRVNCLKYV